MINIKEVVWTNFLGYGDYKSSIEFSDYEGICLIEGEIDGNEEREEGDEKLNAAGKTSIIEAIVWGLFGHLTHTMNPGDNVINWKTGKNCRVSIKTHDGHEIVRMRKYNGLSEVIILKDGDDITKSTSKPAQSYIEETFKISYHNFIRSQVFGQMNGGFLELSDQKIRQVMESLMNIDNLKPIVDTAKGKIEGIDKEIASISSKIESLEREIERCKDHAASLQSKSEGFEESKKNDIEEIRSEMASEKSKIDAKIADINEDIKNKKSNVGNKIDIHKIKEEWAVYNKNVEEYEETLSEIDLKNAELAKLESDRKVLLIEFKSIQDSDIIDVSELSKEHKKVSDAKESLAKLQKLKEVLSEQIIQAKTNRSNEQEFLDSDVGSVCPKCRQEVTGDHLKQEKDECSARIKKYSESIKDASSKLDKVNKNIESTKKISEIRLTSIEDAKKHNDEVIENNNKKNEIKKKVLELTVKIDGFTIPNPPDKPDKPNISVSEATYHNSLIDNIDNDINNLKNRITELKSEFKDNIAKASSRISLLNDSENPYTELINGHTKEARELEGEKAIISKKLSEKKTIRAHLNYIRESYHNKKKIKAFWISELIPEFNKFLEYYLDFFEVEDKIKFDEFLSPKINRWGYSLHSGGERKRIDLSIMFALNDLHTANFGPQSNFMVLDEVDGRVDPFTINKLVSLLSDDMINRTNGPSNIFVISHRREMKDRFPNKIKVKNKMGKSYIVNDG